MPEINGVDADYLSYWDQLKLLRNEPLTKCCTEGGVCVCQVFEDDEDDEPKPA
jgi:hypothetical protein